MDNPSRLPLSIRLLAAFLRVFFKLLYHQLAWTYDLVAWSVSLGMWKHWVLSALPYLQGPRVLELGHGPGHLQAALHRKGVWAIGLDESCQMGRQALLRVRRFGFNPLLVNAYAQFLPFAPRSMNQVVATFPSEYILDPRTLNSVFHSLAPGGLFVVLPLAWITGDKPHEKLAAWLFRFTHQSPDWDIRMTEPFRQAGFSVKVEFADYRSSQVVVILATKPPPPG